jgi:hypothetical protein
MKFDGENIGDGTHQAAGNGHHILMGNWQQRRHFLSNRQQPKVRKNELPTRKAEK